ncbi:hypothetical protein ABF73_14780 [Enterobacter roggenkampii]|nr:hypothetical protein ABF73_14780 [Enterobacter roggenkampii]
MLITAPLFTVRLSCANDTDDFSSAFKTYRMCDQNNKKALHKADGLPAKFTVFIAILNRQMIRIVENHNRILKAYAMFLQVTFRLIAIPLILRWHSVPFPDCIYKKAYTNYARI